MPQVDSIRGKAIDRLAFYESSDGSGLGGSGGVTSTGVNGRLSLDKSAALL